MLLKMKFFEKFFRPLRRRKRTLNNPVASAAAAGKPFPKLLAKSRKVKPGLGDDDIAAMI